MQGSGKTGSWPRGGHRSRRHRSGARNSKDIRKAAASGSWPPRNWNDWAARSAKPKPPASRG